MFQRKVGELTGDGWGDQSIFSKTGSLTPTGQNRYQKVLTHRPYLRNLILRTVSSESFVTKEVT